MDKLVITSSANPGLVFTARWARTMLQRLVGLLKTPSLENNHGLLLSPCSSIHTFGMRYNLDIVFLDREKKILKCVSDLKPNRTAAARKAYYALELPGGTLQQRPLAVGVRLDWVSSRDK